MRNLLPGSVFRAYETSKRTIVKRGVKIPVEPMVVNTIPRPEGWDETRWNTYLKTRKEA